MSAGISRRGLLQIGAAAGGGLLLKIWSPELSLASEVAATPPAEFSPNAYIRITREKTTFLLASTEMGRASPPPSPS